MDHREYPPLGAGDPGGLWSCPGHVRLELSCRQAEFGLRPRMARLRGDHRGYVQRREVGAFPRQPKASLPRPATTRAGPARRLDPRGIFVKIKSIKAFAITDRIAGGTYDASQDKGTARRPPWTKDAEVANPMSRYPR